MASQAQQLNHPSTTFQITSKPYEATLAPADELKWIPLRTTGNMVYIKDDGTITIERSLSSTGKGILIGMLSAFGSALLVALILALVYFLRYTNRGRILLDRMGRPGEYDDEQAFAREEAEALENIDDISRSEYLRAKGEYTRIPPYLVPDLHITF